MKICTFIRLSKTQTAVLAPTSTGASQQRANGYWSARLLMVAGVMLPRPPLLSPLSLQLHLQLLDHRIAVINCWRAGMSLLVRLMHHGSESSKALEKHTGWSNIDKTVAIAAFTPASLATVIPFLGAISWS